MKSTTCSGRATFTIHAPILLLDQIDDCKTLIASTRTKLIIWMPLARRSAVQQFA
jgi:hypothetical protein